MVTTCRCFASVDIANHQLLFTFLLQCYIQQSASLPDSVCALYSNRRWSLKFARWTLFRQVWVSELPHKVVRNFFYVYDLRSSLLLVFFGSVFVLFLNGYVLFNIPVERGLDGSYLGYDLGNRACLSQSDDYRNIFLLNHYERNLSINCSWCHCRLVW